MSHDPSNMVKKTKKHSDTKKPVITLLHFYTQAFKMSLFFFCISNVNLRFPFYNSPSHDCVHCRCAAAYVLLAEEEATTITEAERLFKQALKSGMRFSHCHTCSMYSTYSHCCFLPLRPQPVKTPILWFTSSADWPCVLENWVASKKL